MVCPWDDVEQASSLNLAMMALSSVSVISNALLLKRWKLRRD